MRKKKKKSQNGINNNGVAEDIIIELNLFTWEEESMVGVLCITVSWKIHVVSLTKSKDIHQTSLPFFIL